MLTNVLDNLSRKNDELRTLTIDHGFGPESGSLDVELENPAQPADRTSAAIRALAPSHCGAPMQWEAPALATMTDYSFEPDGGPASLPPVWRCSCGFQVDGILHPSNALASLS